MNTVKRKTVDTPVEGWELGTTDEHYKLSRKISDGNNAVEIWLAKKVYCENGNFLGVSEGKYYVLKINIKKCQKNSPEYIAMLSEAEIGKSLSFQNILNYYGFVYDERRRLCFIVTEYLDGKDLGVILNENNKGLSIDYMIRVLSPVVMALNYMHSRLNDNVKIFHGDIKPENIFIVKSGKVYIIDFGNSIVVSSDDVFNYNPNKGTHAYIPPERCKSFKDDYFSQGDIYSLCVVIYQMLTGELPFGENGCDRKKGNDPLVLKKINSDAWMILKKELSYDWRKRSKNILSFWVDFVNALENKNNYERLSCFSINERKKRQEEIALSSNCSKELIKNDNLHMVFIPQGLLEKCDAKEFKNDCVDSFFMGKYPVTIENFRVFVENSGYEYIFDSPANDEAPITNFNLEDVFYYIDWLNGFDSGLKYRLPTEKEWVYSCRAGSQGVYWWDGSTVDPTKAIYLDYLNYQDMKIKVGETQPNCLGLHDMLGLVWELTHSSDSIILKGGAWNQLGSNVRVKSKLKISNSINSDDVGFRLAAEII